MILWHNMLNDIRHAGWMQRFVWLNVALFIAGALVVPKLASTTFTLLALAGIVLLVRERWPQDLARAEKWLLFAFALYFIVGVVSYNLGIKTRLGWEIIFRDIRFLFAIPVYLILRRYPPPRWLFWSALVLGTVAMLGVAVTDYLSKAAGWRAGGATISIVFGHLGVGVALVCAGGAVFLHGRWQRLLVLCGSLAAIITTILSGTRGAWLAFLGAGGLLLLFWWSRTGWRQRLLSVVVLVVFAAAAGAWLYQPLLGRFHAAQNEWKFYQTTNEQFGKLTLPERGCINQEVFLNAFANALNSGRGLMKAEVVEDATLSEHGCAATGAIRLHNPDRKLSDWLTTPSRAIVATENGTGHAVWLVRGQGAVQFGGTPDSRVRIDSNIWQRLELNYPQARWPTVLTFILGKGQTLDIVPVQIVPGEYTLFYTNSSIGSRLQMWQAAWQVFLAHPLLGAGTGAWQKSTAGLIQSGKVSAVVARYDHAHDDYLTALADRGLAGLAALLLLYGAPLWLFARALRHTGSRAEPVAGILLVGGFMLSGLTETLFNHSIVITYYAVFISFLAVLLRQPPAKEPS